MVGSCDTQNLHSRKFTQLVVAVGFYLNLVHTISRGKKSVDPDFLTPAADPVGQLVQVLERATLTQSMTRPTSNGEGE